MDERLDTTSTIETPERVTFRFRLAGPAQRGVAWGIDMGIVALALGVVALLSLALFAIPGLKGLGMMGGLIAWFFVQWFYGLFFEWLLHGRTPGKVAMLLRVVREDGAPAGFQDLFLRNLLRGVDALPILGGVGVAVMALDPKMRRIGDLAGGTVVVSEERATLHGAVLIDPPVTEEERQAMPARIPLARHEIALVEDLIRRRRRLTEERMEELAALFGPKLSEQTGLEAPTWRRVLVLAYARATGRDRSP